MKSGTGVKRSLKLVDMTGLEYKLGRIHGYQSLCGVYTQVDTGFMKGRLREFTVGMKLV